MPRYFFNVHDGEDIPDQDGSELPDLDAVRVEALRAAGEMLPDSARFWKGQEWLMVVADEAGAPVMTLRFSATTAA